MASTNAKTKKSHVYSEERLAGGYGPQAAKQSEEMQLRRLVMACLLWEDIAYEDGVTSAQAIKDIIPNVPAEAVATIASEARHQQKLRHVPLLIAREMAKLPSHKHLVAKTLADVIRRPDELAEFLSIYWKDNGGKKTLSAQVKKGLATALNKFNEYQLAKWDRSGKDVSLRDVLFLSHAKPKDQTQTDLFKKLVEGTLATPDTWEVAISAAKPEDKKSSWLRLITEGKLGAFAYLKNLRNMKEVGISIREIANGLTRIKPDMLLPIDFLKAAKYAPECLRELETLMLSCAAAYPKLPGWTILVVDVSGSMGGTALSSKSEFNRMDAAAAMAVLAAEMCEHIGVYATAGSDGERRHATQRIPALRGFALSNAILESANRLGGGGIFTRQALDYIKKEQPDVDRIIVFSDSQDCDLPGSGRAKPFGKWNYIVDVSSHKNGINYSGDWTAEIAGWSEHFLRYIAAYESCSLQG